MSEYQLQIKQVVDYPRCRIYRQFAQAGAPVFFILRCFAVMQTSVHPTAA